jgi:hypothetical protein
MSDVVMHDTPANIFPQNYFDPSHIAQQQTEATKSHDIKNVAVKAAILAMGKLLLWDREIVIVLWSSLMVQIKAW